MAGWIGPLSIWLYILLPIWPLSRGRLIQGGMAMVAAALLPWTVWLSQLDEPFGPGAGLAALLTVVLLLVPAVLIAVGLARIAFRRSSNAEVASG